jgi:hypothetical protein
MLQKWTTIEITILVRGRDRRDLRETEEKSRRAEQRRR